MMSSPLATPTRVEDFSPEWVSSVTGPYLASKGLDPGKVRITGVRADKNCIQGILSTTYIVDVEYEIEGKESEEQEDEDEGKISLFVKVPLRGDPLYATVNARELCMLTQVLPKLQAFLDERCEGFFRLPLPTTVHAYYDGSGVKDVFVLENLLEQDYYNFSAETCLDEDHMKAVLDGLCYLHGTGLAFRAALAKEKQAEQSSPSDQPNASLGIDVLKAEFPSLDFQLQLGDLLKKEGEGKTSDRMRDHFRRHFRPFLHFLETEEPSVSRHASYMRKMHTHIAAVLRRLEDCGYQRLLTFAHGDAKPNNFLFRKIEIDLEDLECEGIESILIDWQGGFVGSVANDLMWALFPFIDRLGDGAVFARAIKYYFDQLGHVLASFKVTRGDLGIPNDVDSFASLLRKCLVLEFLIVTVVKPVMALEANTAAKLRRWHKDTVRNTRRRFKRTVIRPTREEVFSSPRFPEFCHLYFHIATALGAFQELGRIHLEVMKESMFEDLGRKTVNYDSDDDDDTDLVSRVINAPSATIAKVSAVVVVVVSVAIGVYFAWRIKVTQTI